MNVKTINAMKNVSDVYRKNKLVKIEKEEKGRRMER